MPQATKESFARALDALLRKYEADRDTYLSSQYNEAQTRTQFITPLLEALGWDVRNEAGVPYNLCEVLEEKGETHGRPDYTFRINGQTKFFLEAKSPSDELSPAGIIQTKRYAWNSRDIFFAGVCDFEQFRFFDASLRPDDKRPLDGEAFHLIYSEYASNIDKLWELSRDRVAAGSLDQFLRKDRKSLLQKVPVDRDFLDNLTIWRHDLGNAIHSQNPQYDAHPLNDIVQRLLDRIIFIRIAEDRKVIDQRQLWDIAAIWEESGGRRNIMEQLVQVFQEFNARFNGEIFKPHRCEEIKIESHALVKIIKQLYPPKSNYRFDVIGVELLGSIYERYLGNTLRITPKRVYIEPKPEVRKAGGVYYTPQYIVDYIVKNTVGKLVEGKTPKEVDKIRILDPACGSGSFLIGAFQFLIDWYLNYYRENPKEAKPGTIFALTRTDPDGNLRLSFSAKSLIIQHNLYGVDIDPQAVEVTMMSLYLKMLEGELGIQIPKQDKLPELKYNIRCGNSLIGPDIETNGKDGKPLTPEERLRINPFDWHSRENGFGDILKSGGFDAVIGNPPYVRIQYMNEWAPLEVELYKRLYKAASSGNYDIYVVFIEKGLSLLAADGKLGFIVPHKFFNSKYGEPLRKLLAQGNHLSSVVHFGFEQVFDGATNYTCLLFLRRSATSKFQFAKVNDLKDWRKSGEANRAEIPAAKVTAAEWNFGAGAHLELLEKLGRAHPKLGDIADIWVGLQTSADDVFIMDFVEETSKLTRLNSKALGEVVAIEKELLHPLVSGTDVRRYEQLPARQYILFPYNVNRETAQLIAFNALSARCPRAASYLVQNRKRLEGRENGKFRGRAWYRFGRSQNIGIQQRVKLCVPRLVERLHAAYDASGAHFLDNVDVGGVTLKPDQQRQELPYLLGLLNSRLLRWFFPHISAPFRGGWFSANRQFLSQLPFRAIELGKSADKRLHEQVIRSVEQILELTTKKHSDKLAPAELQRLEGQIADTDAEIDNLVYELYGITAEERKIIEAQP